MRTFQDGDMRMPVKLWADGVTVEQAAMEQIRHVASLPVVGPHVAIMPDAHWGNGACVGSVIPTKAAIIPAAVGVDLGCGMMAVRTDSRSTISPGRWRPFGRLSSIGSRWAAPVLGARGISGARHPSGLCGSGSQDHSTSDNP
jgi:tRNA-splicing ligase RtcB